jgi:hypothetical protein
MSDSASVLKCNLFSDIALSSPTFTPDPSQVVPLRFTFKQNSADLPGILQTGECAYPRIFPEPTKYQAKSFIDFLAISTRPINRKIRETLSATTSSTIA